MPIHIVRRLLESASRIILGKDHALRLALACVLARGHLLIEDIPGVGKTTLAHVLARLLGLQFQRIQFTSDMLPADIIGVSIFDQRDASFRFHPGPVFSQLLLADEINRATPKAQSALLEAMEERQISAEGRTWPLPEPFFVIATQNPADQIGTFPLPESQLDRFALVLSMGLPDRAAEREILTGQGGNDVYEALRPVADPARVAAAIAAVHGVYCAPALVEYVLDLTAATRVHPDLSVGASPRASVGLIEAARAHAVVVGRDHVTPDDVQAVVGPAFSHRISTGAGVDTAAGAAIVAGIVARTSVPRP